MASTSVPKLYYGVIDDVITKVREAFNDEGIDEQALTDLKEVWRRKLEESKAVERETDVVLNKAVSQPNQPVQQINPNIGAPPNMTPLSLPGNILWQYAAQQTTNDGQKSLPQKLTLTVPAHLAANAGLHTIMSAAQAGTTVQLTPEMASSLFQGGNFIATTNSNSLQHGGQWQAISSEQLKNVPQFTVAVPVTTPQSQIQQSSVIGQIDGANDTSDEEDEDDFADNDDDHDDNDDEQNEDDVGKEDDEPLNSDDDVKEELSDINEIENVVVCQYDKITRSKNRWKFHLKDGIMNLKGKDYVFHKALGDSEW